MIKGEFILLEEIVITVDRIGLEKTLEIIRKSRELPKDKDLLLQEYIIECVCNAFSISRNELIKAKGKTNALAVCSIMLKIHLGYSQGKIASILKKHDSVISKYIKRITYLDSKHQEDKRLLDKLDSVEIKIREFKNNIINNNI
jgi:hypothetical protein